MKIWPVILAVYKAGISIGYYLNPGTGEFHFCPNQPFKMQEAIVK